MEIHNALRDKQEQCVFPPAEDCDSTERDDDLGWFAVSGLTDEITAELIADIKAFLRFVQEQKKARS